MTTKPTKEQIDLAARIWTYAQTYHAAGMGGAEGAPGSYRMRMSAQRQAKAALKKIGVSPGEVLDDADCIAAAIRLAPEPKAKPGKNITPVAYQSNGIGRSPHLVQDKRLTAHDRAGEIRAGAVTEGLSNLKHHALREDGSAACGNHLLVRVDGFAADIPDDCRCQSRACVALFRKADEQKKHHSPPK